MIIKILLKNGETVKAVRYIDYQNTSNIQNYSIYESLSIQNDKQITDQIKYFLTGNKLVLPTKLEPMTPFN